MNWDFITDNELQVRNDMQQELIGDIYLSFLSVHNMYWMCTVRRHHGYDDRQITTSTRPSRGEGRVSRWFQYRVIHICNEYVQRIKGACSQGHLVHEGERSSQWRLPRESTSTPFEGKPSKRGVEDHREIDGTEDESSICKCLEFQESMKSWEKADCECWEHDIRWGVCQGLNMKLGVMLRRLEVGSIERAIAGSRLRLV